ncbi:hypothetical protein AB0D63_38400, partial [Kitasatospora sp. NPDC048343]|uniref:hypothetical protein n=1 Tax=Kitasatospora sp. NPDC048343 TaxID=3154717 RepID=UPI00340DF8FA
MTGAEQGVQMTVRCGACGGTAIRSVGQFLMHGRELWWDADSSCPHCGTTLCEYWGPATVPEDVREALLTTHGPARLRLAGSLTDPLAALRTLREGSASSLQRTRELLAELRNFGLHGTAVEMAYWKVRLAERGIAAEVADGFGRAYRYVGPPELRSAAGPGGRPVRTAGELNARVGGQKAEE